MYKILGRPAQGRRHCPWPAGEWPPAASKTHRRKTARPRRPAKSSTSWAAPSEEACIDAEDTVREGLNRTGGTVRDGFARTKESVQGMGLVPRVYGRLHWDKALHSSQFVVKAEGGGRHHPRHSSRRSRQGQGDLPRERYLRRDPRRRSAPRRFTRHRHHQPRDDR